MIQKIDPRRVIYIVGFSQNKELGSIFIQFRRNNKFIWTRANVQRAISTDTLKNLSDEYQLDGEVCEIEDALDRALAHYQSGGLMLVTGSAFVVADIMKVMIKQNKLVIE